MKPAEHTANRPAAPGGDSLSVVVPALDAAHSLGPVLAALTGQPAGFREVGILVVDGGSTDGTRALARAAGARLVEAARGRGAQLAAGAAAAPGDWLLFLHADSLVSPGCLAVAAAWAARPGSRERAAAFRFALDDPSPAARRIERLVAWRCRVLGLPWGDQGLLIARDFYQARGGYRPLPVMEDADFVRRLGRRRIDMLDCPVITSARRYRRDGWILRPARNLLCLGLWWSGLPVRLVARLYG